MVVLRTYKEYLISDETFKEAGHYIQKKLKVEKALLSGKKPIDDTNALHFICPDMRFVSQGTLHNFLLCDFGIG
ncbi:MAG TPA: hypothetical protein VGW09_08980 [Nitrososphaeraceae archaeon]|nr:hypothetical protein [Nitrososphaeraceae archaeon]